MEVIFGIEKVDIIFKILSSYLDTYLALRKNKTTHKKILEQGFKDKCILISNGKIKYP